MQNLQTKARQVPDTARQVPDTARQVPDTARQEPDTARQEPDTARQTVVCRPLSPDKSHPWSPMPQVQRSPGTHE